MWSFRAVPFVIVGVLASVGCSQPPADTTKTTTETKTKQVGSTVEQTAVTKVATAEGDTTAITNTYVGTVTVYEAGKRIEVMTGNKELHAFALDGKDDRLAIDYATAVGSKVQLIEAKGPEGGRQVTVTIAPSSE